MLPPGLRDAAAGSNDTPTAPACWERLSGPPQVSFNLILRTSDFLQHPPPARPPSCFKVYFTFKGLLTICLQDSSCSRLNCLDSALLAPVKVIWQSLERALAMTNKLPSVTLNITTYLRLQLINILAPQIRHLPRELAARAGVFYHTNISRGQLAQSFG